ncbi:MULTISPECIES: acyl-CoA dehydrogenase [Carboxydocella]|uniref:Acyl-CoA dehydrogenase n=2 Tax=Carboxydocella TaxID=178898 RepID=A0A1T4LU56_9FIRM|nr:MULTISPECIES: acyl-CoA dehydrogenase [Carboxydocella]AVX20611.1 Acyl-CoA dehydrogenase [Carboxydocella thermautotrophica]AVX31033.1 Acyl-CoA dehydrogenase [Carboxydocella thermautotrophica]SJZ58146.1 Acyl-CoA dehydrogenase [Carboxydocella sporoproducens DSM 16521]GAW27934.1 acyl-CoA dehydrogenase [Carboxydocella sp. ULO1]GAW31539.1 acyl-CoA dehydrogenase [Carboxydocella sp. JDF658]
MIFKLTEEQEMLRNMVRDFAEKECGPTAAERDEKETFDRSIFDKMAELGLTGIVFPEEYGGAGADYISYAIAVEELSRVDASVGVTLSAHTSLGSNPIYKFGTEEQKQKYLVPLAEGKKMGAFGLTEPFAGSDAGGTRTTAVLDGDEWVLNGTKIFITNGGEAEIYVVFAMTDKEAKPKHKGISAFIVEKGTPGFTFGKKEHKLGIRSSPTMELVFDNCRIPKENLLGQLGEGFKIAMVTLDYGRIGIAAQALGIAQGAYEAALNYAKERKQFGQPIANFQAIQFMLADMATEIEAARLLVYRAAYLASQGVRISKEAAMAKMYASDVAMKVTTNAVQIFGGYGYTREFPVERMMRDAKITQIYEGTNEIQRVVISANILKE